MMINPRPISAHQIDLLQHYWQIQNIAAFRHDIHQVIDGTRPCFGFPYHDKKGEVKSYSYFDIGYQRQTSECGSAWIVQKNIVLDIDFWLISDNPVSLIRYYARNFERLKHSACLLFAPRTLNDESYQWIQEKYCINSVISIFDNPINQDFQRIKLSGLAESIQVDIEYKNSVFIIKTPKQSYVTRHLSFADFRKRLRLKNKIKHLNNKP